MNQTQVVDASISRTPLPLDGTDLATLCVLCSHNCGLRVDVKDGHIVAIRADDAQEIGIGHAVRLVDLALVAASHQVLVRGRRRRP